MKRLTRKNAVKATVVSSAMLMGLAAGSMLAYGAVEHNNIVLKDHDGSLITLDAANKGNAYSVRTTCFGTDNTGCHGDANAINPTVKLGYDKIEQHNYHALNSSNELRGFNAWNPDGVLPNGKPDPVRRGVGTQGKNWVQSTGHMGSW